MKYSLLYATLLCSMVINAQTVLKVIVRNENDRSALPGTTVSIPSLNKTAQTDSNGVVLFRNIPAANLQVNFSHIGFKEKILHIEFSLASDTIIEVLLSVSEFEEDEVVITSTRTSRSIANIPTRVETISGQELDEKGNMKPGDIRMMLNESTGIQTQQTSVTSYNSSIRIQGLDGKYTQILRDGFPLYDGFSGGLGLLQIVPLDLRQVEVIKGPVSTLYGGGAIAGLVNLVSKTPREKRELSLMANATSAAGLDLSAYYSRRFKKTGTTIFISYNHGSPYDPSETGLTAIPKFNRFTLNPKLFLYFNKKTTSTFGINASIENRIGGDILAIKGNGDLTHSWFEKNQTYRFSTQFTLDHHPNDHSAFSFRNSISYYDRSIGIPGFLFAGKQLSSFSEANYECKIGRSEWVAGINFLSDRFKQDKNDTIIPVNYDQHTIALFVQNTYKISEKIICESGLRSDYQDDYGFFLLPRVSVLFKTNQHFNFRVGGGLGYKTPNVFTEDAERVWFRNVLPINSNNSNPEKSIGGSFDINFKSSFSTNKVSLSINQLFFYTRINDPLVLTLLGNGDYEYLQPTGFIDTKGIETNIKLSYKNFKLFLGYTLSSVNQHYQATTKFPLVARNRLNNVLIYEIEDKLKVGLEAYYFSPQQLNDGTIGKSYWLSGLMAEKLWDHFSIFVNFENWTDIRQTKFGPIYTGTITQPVFKDIYAPIDGFVVNGGLKIRL